MRFLALLAAATLASAATSPCNPKIDPTLWSLLESNQPVDAMIKLKEQSQPVVETSDVKDPAERIRNKLVAATSKSAAMVKSLLTPRSRRLDATQCPGSATSSYLWIAGRMHIKGLTLCMAQEIAASESVLRRRKEEVEEIDTTAQASPVDTLPELWAANMIRAPAVWSSSNTGQGIVIGSIDTGVRATHSL
ncbi:hypothetical protein LEN26_017274 [Aphanomyces euteiches]|nr:hypothetical protein LEN26_017274 [Aphanomyces euteiches]KAH9112235.1 hypothetical protein AeMF1_013410 [Aphanomyces euteiches]